MNELENLQPEESLESVEPTERLEEQTLDDAAHEPGSRVEETVTYEQSEAIEETLVEVIDTTQLELAAEDGTVDRDDDGLIKDPDLSEASGDDDDKDEATPINLPGPVAEDDDVDMQLISGPSRDDLPDGTGILEEPHKTVEMAEKLEERGIADRAEIPDGIEFELAQGDSDDDGKDEATPINLPGPVAAVAQDPMPDPDPGFYTPRVAEEPDPGPDPFQQAALSPDDVKLEPAPDFKDMQPSEQAVVEIIGRAIADDEYRTTLFDDARAAIRGYDVSDDDQIGLGEMTQESFNFFAAEVEARFGAAIAENPQATEQQVMAQVVHAVWRDLNPGGLVYVLTHKIPHKHLS